MTNKFYKPSARSNISPFHVMNLLQKAKKMESNKKKIFHLELGEPQMLTPKLVLKEVSKLSKLKIPGYTPSNGILELRERIAEYYIDNYSVRIPADRIFITTGSSGAFLLSFLVNFDPGSKVVVFNPVYPAYRNILKCLNIDVVEIYSNNINEVNLNKIEQFQNVDGVIISNPNNPNGQVFSSSELEYIYNYCKKKKIKLILDEIYHGIIFEKKVPSILNFGDNAIVINSFSKYFCMPGWRLGWVIVPEILKDNLLKLSQNLFISSGNIAQYAALKVFDCIDELNKIVVKYKKNRESCNKILNDMPLLQFTIPAGSFYYYIDISKLKIDSTELCDILLKKYGLAITPGIDFDKKNGHKTIRVSFSSNHNIVVDGLGEFKKWYKKNY